MWISPAEHRQPTDDIYDKKQVDLGHDLIIFH